MNSNELFLENYVLPEPLKKEEMRKLIQEANTGSTEARDRLITHNIRLVLHQVYSKFKRVKYDRQDLVSIGSLGLIKAVNTYDITKGYEFTTYATRCINNEILMFLRKLKRNKEVDSIDRNVIYTKNGNELKLEDILFDNTNPFEDVERKEIQKSVRKLVDQLPNEEKEVIMLYFGFYNNRIYTQKEIASKLKVSMSSVSNLISSIVEKIGEQLKDIGIVEERDCSHIRKTKKVEIKKPQTIYEYFNKYTREEVDKVLSKLSEDDKALIRLKYGEDLDNPIITKLCRKDSVKFYSSLVRKMKKLLENPLLEAKSQPKKSRKKEVISQDIETEISISHQKVENDIKEKEIITPNETQKPQILETSYSEEKINITKSDFLRMLNILKTSPFKHIMSELTFKELVIISLKLGYLDGKCFSTEAIAQFLGIKEIDVIEATKKALILQKENINGSLDYIEEIETNIVDISNFSFIKKMPNK